MQAKPNKSWGNSVGTESRKSFLRWLEDGFYEKYLSGNNILDIGFKGYIEGATPITPSAIGIDLDYPGYNGRKLPFSDNSQDCVFNSHTLEHIDDYKNAIQDWFRVLKPNGFMIIVVPHWCLYERKSSLASVHNADHKRFYTACSLLKEIDEALDPFSYRIRHVEDNDRGFDYTVPPGSHAVGSYEIICVIEKIKRPKYADKLISEIKPKGVLYRFLDFFKFQRRSNS